MSASKVFMSLGDAAEILSVSTETIRRRIADGTLPGYRIGDRRTVRVRVDDVIALAKPIPTAQKDEL